MKHMWTSNKVFLYDELIQLLVISRLSHYDVVAKFTEFNTIQSLLSIFDFLLVLIFQNDDFYPILSREIEFKALLVFFSILVRRVMRLNFY